MDITTCWSWDGYDNDDYRWLSDHALLYGEHYNPEGNRIAEQRFFRYDLRTHTRTKLKRLTRLVRCLYHSQMEVSPDGKWLLWHGGNADVYTLDAATLDGKQHLRWPGGYWTQHILTWTADSRHWIEFHPTSSDASPGDPLTAAVIHNVTAPHQKKVLAALPGSLDEKCFADISVHDHIVFIDDPESDAAQQVVRVVEAHLASRIAPLREHTILPPSYLRHPTIEQCCLSPQGDKIALVLTSDTYLLSHDVYQRAYGIWVCNLDGSDMQEIGYWLQEANPNDILDLDGLSWLPSSKRLSFVYDDTLWTVPVG
jgi:hypothetical protein